MKHPHRLFYGLVCWLIFTAAACVPVPSGRARESALPVKVLRTGLHCLPAPATWTVTWIASPDLLKQMISKCRANRIGFPPEAVPDIDFTHFGVLAVQMGQKPTTGYGFDAQRVTAYAGGKTVTVTLEWNGPLPEHRYAQMMTAPWILIRLPVDPACRRIQVVDQDGHFLARTDIP